MIYLLYLLLAISIVFLSNKASVYVDMLDKKTKLSGAFIGGVMLSAVTSLPELFTSLSATLMLNEPGLCVGNILGSDLFNITILSILILISFRSFSKTKIAKSHIIVTLAVSLMYLSLCLNMLGILDFKIFSVSITSVILIILYIVGVKNMAAEDGTENYDEGDDLKYTVKGIVVRFIIVSIGIIGLSIAITFVTDTISVKLNIGNSLAGAIFLGVATSLPEVSSTIALFRIENHNIAVGNIVGSNLFNFIILALADILYIGNGIYDFSDFTVDEKKRYEEYSDASQSFCPPGRGRADHLALDNEKLISIGVEGVIAQIEKELSNTDLSDGRNAEKYEFYKCCLIELNGVISLQKNYRDYAYGLAKKSEGKQREEYLALAETLNRVPAKPARTFREALRSIQLFTFSLFGIYSIGRPDQYLYPLYEKDIKTGVMTAFESQELIDCFYLQYMNNMSAWAAASFMIGGRDSDGNPVENELTWHFLEAIRHTHTPDPNVGFCVTSETSEQILNFVASIIKEGHGQPQIWNNDVVTKSMTERGYDSKAANLFTQSTCVEITPIACSVVSITSPYINMLKIFLDAFKKCDDNMGFDEIYDMFVQEFESYCKETVLQENLWQLERKRNATDPVRISAFINDCIKRGLSSESGGALYNDIEPNMLGMINVVESLNVIKQIVYEKKMITISEFQKALEKDYDGYEDLRQYIINKTEHFGTGNKEINNIAKRVADTVIDTFNKFTTFRGAKFIPGAFSYREHEINGRMTDASPDGRYKGTTLADGSSPVQGYDNMGPSLSLHSSASWENYRFLGGISVNIKLNSNIPQNVIIDLIKGYIREGGMQIQFNIVDAETLKDAQKKS